MSRHVHMPRANRRLDPRSGAAWSRGCEHRRVDGREIDRAFLHWLEAKVGHPDVSEAAAINYLVALALVH